MRAIALRGAGVVAALAILSIGVQHSLNPFDEGYVLYGAQRVLEGSLPYRDFWVVYMPGQFYAVAAVFAMFGSSVLAMRSSLPRARGIVSSVEQETAVSYVHAHTAPGEPIFVGHARHDRLVANDIAFYFLADRPAASRWVDLCPGVVTTRPVQEEIVAALERQGVRYVVTRAEFGGGPEPNESGRSSGVRVLDRYLRRRFRLVARYGDFTIRRRRADALRPAGGPGHHEPGLPRRRAAGG